MRTLTTLKIALVAAVSSIALDASAQQAGPASPAGAAPASATQAAPNPRAAAAAAAAKRAAEAQTKPTPRDAKGKPVLVGFWAGPVTSGPGGGQAIRKPDGSIELTAGEYGAGGRRPMPADMPKYKPQYRDLSASPTKQGTVDYADVNQPLVDEVFLGAPPGIPRAGPPHAITQIGDVLVFLYHDLSGSLVRMIPTDGRKPRDYVDPSYMGESVGRWEGDTLVIESSNFVETTWLGERGYFHGPKLKVVERVTRKGDALTWSFTATDPDYLLEPWTQPARTVVKENEIWEEVPPFHDLAAPNLVNTDNHGQR